MDFGSRLPESWRTKRLAGGGSPSRLRASIAAFGTFCIFYLLFTGVGVWGNNIPVGWAWDITNFVFWIGIGHAGTLISAILHLCRQKWRTSINRAAEAMTLFAVICAGIFPGIHVGRIWMAWFMAPVPNPNWIWPNFRSPLMWDVFAVSTYFTVSVLFWYLGLVPDLATMRDRAKGRVARTVYWVLSFGWRGGNRQWRHYEMAYLVLAGISTPLVLSVHSTVSFDFATSVLPGWHTTIFPPYFVAGAIFGGFAMVLTLMLPARSLYKLHDIFTWDHIDVMCKLLLLTGSIVGYAYCMEFFVAFYGANPFERFAFLNRYFGPYWWASWTMFACNVVMPQLMWVRAFRRNWAIVFFVSMCANAGMWFERFVIFVISLHRDFLPSAWRMYYPTWVDAFTFIGTFGIFLTLFLLFIRFLPMVAMSEVKGVLPEADPHYHPPALGRGRIRERGARMSAATLTKPAFAIVAEFSSATTLYEAAEKVRDAGFKFWDVHSPFPIHGMNKAMGLGRSPLGYIIFCGGFLGFTTAVLLEFIPSSFLFPLIVHGKPVNFFTVPPFFPIMFELTVLISAFTAFFGVFILNRLPRLHHPLFDHEPFNRVTNDAFFLVIESVDPKFSEVETREFLEGIGGTEVTLLYAND